MSPFGDLIAEALPRFQERAEALMVDTCTITRQSDGWTVVDGIDTPSPPTTIYEGRAKVQTFEPYEQKSDIGGSTEVSQRYHVHVPVGAGPFEIGDVVTMTSGATVGRTFRVSGLHEKTFQTAQRLLVDEGGPS